MPKVESFEIVGLLCWFWSNDHDPPHFHAKKEGEWEINVKFAEGEKEMFQQEWGDTPRGEGAPQAEKGRESAPNSPPRRVGGKGKQMTTKTSKGRLVEFFATSSRLAHAARSAAKRNKNLARYSAIHEVGHAGSLSEVIGAQNLHVVVLSHADDDHLVLTDAGMEAMVSEAFHLLFTEPATHPDQIAHWIRRTKIRSEHRLHIARVDDLEAPQVSELLGRICHAFGPVSSRGTIVDAYLGGSVLSVRGPKQRLLHVPVVSIPALRSLSPVVLRDFRIDPDGSFIHWPVPDIHLGWNQLLQAVDPLELHKALQRSADFNRRYGAAIRKLREVARIPQAKVKGITERQLRRIEHGECRATLNALQDLAQAHGLAVNVYMEKVANAMS